MPPFVPLKNPLSNAWERRRRLQIFSFPNKAIFFNTSVRRRFAPPSPSKTGSKGSKDQLDQRHPEVDKAKRSYSEFLSPLDGLRPLIQDFCVYHVQLLDNYTRPAYSWVIEAVEGGRFRFSFVNPAAPRSLSSDPNYLSKKPSKKGYHSIQIGIGSQDSSTFFPLFEAYFHPRPQAGFEYLFLSRGGSLMSISSGDRWILMSRKASVMDPESLTYGWEPVKDHPLSAYGSKALQRAAHQDDDDLTSYEEMKIAQGGRPISLRASPITIKESRPK